MQIFLFFFFLLEMKNKNVVSRQEFATTASFLSSPFPSLLGKACRVDKKFRAADKQRQPFLNLQRLLLSRELEAVRFLLTIYFELIKDKTIMGYRCEKKKSKAKERRLKRKKRFFRKPSKMRSFHFSFAFFILRSFSSLFSPTFSPPSSISLDSSRSASLPSLLISFRSCDFHGESSPIEFFSILKSLDNPFEWTMNLKKVFKRENRRKESFICGRNESILDIYY